MADDFIEAMIEELLDYVEGYIDERDMWQPECVVCPSLAVIKDEGGLWWCLSHYTG